ncbi:hypothetical protein C8J57DRAFT_296200 [Mycena rebaudengoi]|nr:hypothetical protein C8J57DRAFT_296200 [Mycena rebaudengoi]
MAPPVMDLAGIIVGTLLYGIYFMLFLASVYLLLERKNGTSLFASRSWSIMFLSSCTLFLVVTGHWIVTMCRAFIGFIYFHDGAGAVAFFKDNTQATTTALNVFVGLAFVVGDGMIIYRLWIVWSRNKFVVALPVLAEIALAISYTILVVLRSRLSGKDISATKLVTPVSALTLGINIYCTALISYQIWTTTRAAVPANQTNLIDIIIIVVESAALYTILMVVYEITYQLNSQVQYAEALLIPPIIGIANALIQVRIGLRKKAKTPFATSLTTAPFRLTVQKSTTTEVSYDKQGIVPQTAYEA